MAGAMRTSEPVSYYFSLPVSVKRMRLASRGPVLAAGYNRPPGLVRELTVPDDYYVPYLRDERQPSWFPLKPDGHERLYGENRTVLLTVQFRPPADVPDLLHGRYQWEDFHPQGRWLARPILTEWEDPGFFRPEVSPSLYRPVRPGAELTLDFATLPGLRTVSPKIVYTRKEPQPASLRTFIDGGSHDEDGSPGEEARSSCRRSPRGSTG
ncbi:MAG: hypothetical protein MZV70_13675 [Desulfobacterales bacterium]|nr:hypothetical protein [Desulfobacterales bacterium]